MASLAIPEAEGAAFPVSARAVLDRYIPPAVRERLFRPTGEAVGLPGALYTDPAFFTLERDLTFSRNWVCAGIVDDLPDPGDAMPVDIAGVPVLLVHGRDGVIRAFHNFCRHRGVRLVCEAVTRRPTLVCPYHAWSFGLDGRLLKTPGFGGPGADRPEGFDPAQHGLKPMRCESWARLLFVNLDPEAPSLREHLAPLLARWQAYDFGRLRHGGGLRYELDANWKLVIENFVERYHLPHVHPNLNSYSSVRHTFHITDSDRYVGVGSLNFAPPPPEGGPPLPIHDGLSDEQLTRAEYVALFPNVMLGCHANHFYAFILQPVSVAHTRERFEFFFVGDEALAPEYAPARQQQIDLIRIVNGEDIDIVQRLHQGVSWPGMEGCVFSPVMEDTTHRFQRMVVERLLADAAKGALS